MLSLSNLTRVLCRLCHSSETLTRYARSREATGRRTVYKVVVGTIEIGPQPATHLSATSAMSSSPSRLPVYKHSLRRHVPSHVHAAALEPPREHPHARSVSLKSKSSDDTESVQARRSKRKRAKEAVEHFFDKFHHHHHDQHDHDHDHGVPQPTKGALCP